MENRFVLEPSWCPLHRVEGPCMQCLVPDVIQSVIADGEDVYVVIHEVDQNVN